MTKKHDWCVISLADSDRSAQINIRGRIGAWGATVEDIGAQVAGLDVDTIRVRINSLGGHAHEGIAIHNVLRDHPAKVITIVEGVAGSAASLIAMAGDECVMYANALMMIHGARVVDDWGDDVDTPEAREAVRAFNAAQLETYMARTGKTAEELAPLLETDTWMTAREAVAAGFADRVEELRSNPEEVAAQSALAVFADAVEIPADVLSRALAEAGVEASANDEPETSEGGDPSADPGAVPEPAGIEASTTFAAQVNAMAVAEGMGDYVDAWLLDGDIETVEEARVAIAEAKQVRDLCLYVGVADSAPAYIRSRKSLADVRREIINAKAAKDAATITDSTIPTRSVGPANASGAAVWSKIFPTRQTKE